MAGEGESVISEPYDCVLETFKIDASHLYIGRSIKLLEHYLLLYPEALPGYELKIEGGQ